MAAVASTDARNGNWTNPLQSRHVPDRPEAVSQGAALAG